MAKEDKDKIAFITHWGIYACDIMSFGLKNASAAYQQAMVTLFHNMMHKEIEVYMDDMIAKSRTHRDHLIDLRKLFKRLVKYRLRLNPNKCVFEANSKELLSFIVRNWSGPSKSPSHQGHTYAENQETSSKLLGKDQLHSPLHSAIDHHVRSLVQALKEGYEDRMDRWVLSGLWQD